MQNKFKLSVNTGFALNRFAEVDDLASFCKNYLNIKFIQPTSDWLNLNMPRSFSTKRVKKINKIFSKHDLKVNSTFTGAYTRLNHLAHPDRSHQEYWIDWFKHFINVSVDLGAKSVGSHLGILTYKDNQSKKRDSILINRVLKNWNKIAEYASKKKLNALIWEPMSISREFGDTISECKKIQKKLNQKSKTNFKICLDLYPQTILAPTLTVSGLSVLFLIVKHGVCKMHASSCTPPESVKINFAFFCKFKKSA